MLYPLDVQLDIDTMTLDQFAFFEDCVERGNAPRLAVVLTFRAPPMIRSDTMLAARFGSNGKQFEDDPEAGDMLVQRAKMVDPNFSPVGKIYQDGLCRREVGAGDPLAWVSGDQLTSHIKKVCDMKGADSQGIVNYTSTKRDEEYEDKPYRVADSVVNKHVIEAVQCDPGLADKKDVVEMVRDRLTPKDL